MMVTLKVEDDMAKTIIAALENQIEYWQKILVRCVDPVDKCDCQEFISDATLALEMVRGQV